MMNCRSLKNWTLLLLNQCKIYLTIKPDSATLYLKLILQWIINQT